MNIVFNIYGNIVYIQILEFWVGGTGLIYDIAS